MLWQAMAWLTITGYDMAWLAWIACYAMAWLAWHPHCWLRIQRFRISEIQDFRGLGLFLPFCAVVLPLCFRCVSVVLPWPRALWRFCPVVHPWPRAASRGATESPPRRRRAAFHLLRALWRFLPVVLPLCALLIQTPPLAVFALKIGVWPLLWSRQDFLSATAFRWRLDATPKNN